MLDYLKLLRPKHWIKNVLIFVPSIFGGVLFEKEAIEILLIGFISFCLIASCVYCINDIGDRNEDRLHEVKKNRPIASGRISVQNAILVVIALTVSAALIVIICFKGAIRNKLLLVLIVYYLLNVLYSKGLKNCPIIDVLVLASGFVLRVVYGSIASGTVLSQWLLLTVFMFSLYMGTGKRRNELRRTPDASTRKSLSYYTDSYLSRIMLVTMTLGIAFYSLWASLIVKQSEVMVWTVPLVMAILMKYELAVDSKDCHGDPVEVLTNDKLLLFMISIYTVIVFAVLYK